MRKLSALLLVILSGTLGLWAYTYNVGVVDLDGTAVFDHSAVLSSYFDKNYREDVIDTVKDRAVRTELNTLYKKLDSAFKSDDAQKVETAREQIAGFDADALNIGTPEVKYTELSCTPDEAELYTELYDLDLILFFIGSKADTLTRYSVIVFRNGETERILDRFSDASAYGMETVGLIEILLPYFYPDDAGILYFTDSVPKFDAFSNDLVKDRFIILPEGIYTSPVSPDASVYKGQTTAYTYKEPVISAQDILLISNVQDALITAENTGYTHFPAVISGTVLPFAVTVSKDGFSDRQIQITENSPSVYFDMRPSFLGDYNDYKEAREKFYISMARTVAVFALDVFIGSLNASTLQTTARMAARSAVFVSISDMVYRLFEYYRSSSEMSL